MTGSQVRVLFAAPAVSPVYSRYARAGCMCDADPNRRWARDDLAACRRLFFPSRSLIRLRRIEMRRLMIDVEADQAMAASFLDKALRSRNVATGPINPIKKAAFVPNPLRGCRPRLERYENISRSSVIVSGQA